MSPIRIAVVILAALVCSIGAALFARSLAAPARKPAVVAAAPAPAETPMARVLVAARELQPGDRLTTGDFRWQEWPKSGLNKAFITDGPAVSDAAPISRKLLDVTAEKARDTLAGGAPGASAEFVGAIVRQPVLEGQPLVRTMIVKGADAGMMAVSLEAGMRAMSVPLTAESSAGGFIMPGDHVDVVQSRKVDAPGGQPKFASGAVLRNVKVLAIDGQTKPGPKQANQVGQTATLEVTADQAELLALSKSQGELTLILRSYADSSGPASAGGGPKLAQSIVAAPSVVKVYRNGQPFDVQVAR